MHPFELTSVGRIVFGRGKFQSVGEIAAGFGHSALVVTTASHGGVQSVFERAQKLLSEKGIACAQFSVKGEPTANEVDAGVAAAKASRCDLLIGLGGGSAIDAAKAIAGLLGNGGVALDYMEVVGRGQKITQPALPWIAVPTTAGTGAEATRNAVIGCPEKSFKASIRSEQLLPKVALIDPELALTLPPAITASCGMDAMTQLIESYTSTGANPVTDALALQGLRLAARSLKRAWRDGSDYEAREDMALAALLSGITLANAGLGAVHGFAAPLGARFPVPHGTVCAALLPHVIAANISALRTAGTEAGATAAGSLARYAEVGRVLFGNHRPDEEALEAAEVIPAELVKQFKIPALASFGITEKDVPELVGLAQKSSSMRYNPVVLPPEVLTWILRSAL
ncbi:MAG TPA: iron-containing alcohol dehydrogenase [Planctomycetota bacterium]|jgi:alcohol dehydrogenase class IV